MIVQVTMPVSLKTNQYEAMFISNGHPQSVDRHNARLNEADKAITEAEERLNQLLNDDYSLVTQYETETQTEKGIVFVLHRPDWLDDERPALRIAVRDEDESDDYRDIEPTYTGDGFTEEYEAS